MATHMETIQDLEERREKESPLIFTCIEALAGYELDLDHDHWCYCHFCTGEMAMLRSQFTHKPDCPVLIARQLKAEWEKKP